MMKKLFLTSLTKQETKNGKKSHGTYIMLLLFALLLNSQNSFSQIYNFDSSDEGFKIDNAENGLTVVWNNVAGYLECETTQGTSDPRVFNTLNTPFSTIGLDQLNIRVQNGSNHNVGTMTATVQGDGQRTYNIVMVKNATEFQDISIDLSNEKNGLTWPADGTITALRLDPNGNGNEGVGPILYDYIRFQNSSTLSSSNAQVSEVQTALYPNPVTQGQDVNIQLANTNKQQYKHIAVYDLQGRSVMNRSLDSNESPKLSTSQLTKGIYFVHLGDEDSSEVFKLIVD